MTDKSSLAALVQKCTFIISLKAARQLHALIITSAAAGSESPSPYIHNNIVSMYARCDAIRESHLVFDKMSQRNVVSFNALIAAYSRSPDDAPMAFELLAQMDVERLRPTGSTLTSLLQAASSIESPIWSSSLHAQVEKRGFVNDVRVQTSLIGAYSNRRELESAGKVFRWMLDKDAVAWNSMIFGNLRQDKLDVALRLFHEMVRTRESPTQFTYSMVLNTCSRNGDFHFGRLVHARIITSNSLIDRTLQNVLLDLYCNCGDIHTALWIFNRMENPDLVTWNTMISGCSENEEEEKAMNLFIQLLKSSPSKPDDYTYATIISTVGSLRTCGTSFHALAIKEGLESSVFISSALVSMYFKNGDSQSAETVFYSVLKKDAVLWTEMITGYSGMDDGEKAIKYFSQMHESGHKIDGFSLSAALSACADIATLKQGETIHSQAIKTGFDDEISVCGSLIEMYAKNGDLKSSELVFSEIQRPDLKCWNSMIGGYSHHGRLDQALKLLLKIQNLGFEPDQVTFLSLLSACNHTKSVETGKFLWNHMKENNIFLGPKHYSSMVSLLSRANYMEEAEELIMQSPFLDENRELWRTLLSSCVVHKNLRVGVHAAKEVMRLDSEDSAAHVLVSNLYAGAGKWDAVAEMRRRMRETMMGKDPGVSWIEGKMEIQVFSCGFQQNPEVEEALTTLQKLRGNMSAEVDELSYCCS